MPKAPPGQTLIKLWARLQSWPGGSWVFSRLLWFAVPYSSSIVPHIRHIEPGYARVTIKDRRRLRNHLRSIHALALSNLGELTSGLAMVALLPPTIRGIPTRITTDFSKKARGPLTAECRCLVPEITEATTVYVEAHIRDSSGDVVATVRVDWLLDLIAP